MSDAPIHLQPDVPEPLRAFVVERVEPVFDDVRRLLALPRIAGSRACEAVTLPALFSVLGGLSRVFFSGATGDRQGFLSTAERYPTDAEPAHAIKDPRAFAEALHAHYQASLVHGLGLHMKRDGRYEPWRLAPVRFAGRDLRLRVERLQAMTAGEALLSGLEAPDGWLAGVGPTLSLTSEGLRLEVDAFYCGLRRLVPKLAHDVALAAGAATVLAPWYSDGLRSEAEQAARILDGDGAVPSSRASLSAAAPVDAIAAAGRPAQRGTWRR
jgi:hypothetical protein